jgi:hypothetical protein
MMFRKNIAVGAAGTVLAFAAATQAFGATVAIDKRIILAEHNRYRTQVGVPPLTWSNSLADGAQRWADTMALLDKLQHSRTEGVGENLAYWSGTNASLANLIGLWGQERRYFVPGTFPQVSRDGNWLSVGHYTQMVWRNTTQVGCGMGNNGRTDFLVCWYSPQGNYIGQVPY